MSRIWNGIKNFARKAWGGIKKVVGGIVGGVKKIAPIAGMAAPIISKIPVVGPALGIGAKAIGTIGKVIS